MNTRSLIGLDWFGKACASSLQPGILCTLLNFKFGISTHTMPISQARSALSLSGAKRSPLPVPGRTLGRRGGSEAYYYPPLDWIKINLYSFTIWKIRHLRVTLPGLIRSWIIGLQPSVPGVLVRDPARAAFERSIPFT
jgi:hypothetical protein